jgi:hypothetical protein
MKRFEIVFVISTEGYSPALLGRNLVVKEHE